MFRLTNKTVIVTGGGSGIGKAICKIFARQGASVFIADMDEASAAITVNEITRDDGTAVFIQCNVADEQQAADFVEQIYLKENKVDVLVNNAGIAHIGTAETTAMEDFQRLFDINVKGVYNFLRAVIPHMKKSGGAIVNMASAASSVGIAERFAYSMTKGAVVGMTLSVAKDFIHDNIRCNCISPGRVHTPFVDGYIAKNYQGKEAEMFEKLSKTQPIGRMGEPEEIASLALYLSSDEASFVTGCNYHIDGGFTRLNS